MGMGKMAKSGSIIKVQSRVLIVKYYCRKAGVNLYSICILALVQQKTLSYAALTLLLFMITALNLLPNKLYFVGFPRPLLHNTPLTTMRKRD